MSESGNCSLIHSALVALFAIANCAGTGGESLGSQVHEQGS